MTITPSAHDSIIQSGSPDTNGGSAGVSVVGLSGVNEANSLFQFKLSSIPAVAVIVNKS
jgi:hypothetical protein